MRFKFWTVKKQRKPSSLQEIYLSNSEKTKLYIEGVVGAVHGATVVAT